MAKKTGIAWTDSTFNPHWGCARVSPGCENCYAETFAKRFGVKWGVHAERREFGDKHWREPLKWDKEAGEAGERRRVFCASMADLFEDHDVAARSRDRLWPLIKATPHLDWLLLTKRPQHLARMLPSDWGARGYANVWLGTTVEDQKRANERIPHLVAVPAVVRFLSCEPLLERVDLTRIDLHDDPHVHLNALTGHLVGPDDLTDLRVHWVIAGGESGHGARPCATEWIESLVEQCRRADVPVFVKQLGEYVVSEHRTADVATMTAISGRPAGDYDQYRAPNGEVWAWRAGFAHKKGGDADEWPAELRVREVPILAISRDNLPTASAP